VPCEFADERRSERLPSRCARGDVRGPGGGASAHDGTAEAGLAGMNADAQTQLRAEVILNVEGASEPRNGARERQRELVWRRGDRPASVRGDLALDVPEPSRPLVEPARGLAAGCREPAADDRQGALGPPRYRRRESYP